MREVLATVTSKGQVTIPAEVRRLLGVGPNTKVAFVVDPDTGSVRLQAPKYPTIESLVGAAGSLKIPMTLREMREIAYTERWRDKLTRVDD